ncbi:MAG: hypothetical protein ACRDY0_09470 [Acidimicrobiales bacterium]
MPRILDTTPSFEAFARKAFLESPYVREKLWEERYEGAHPEVFEAFYSEEPSVAGRSALVRDLTALRELAGPAAAVMATLVTEVEPRVARALGMAEGPRPGHVLLVGPMSASAVVGQMGEEITLFHCVEWFKTEPGARILVAHEDTHAFHQLRVSHPVPTDLAWTAFYEGVALRASREVLPGRAEQDYYWYGYAGFDDWLPWCRDHAGDLLARFGDAIDDPAGAETFFGAGLVDGQWRVGFYVADLLVGRIGRTLPELVAMTVDEGRAAVLDALGGASGET